ncbi:hypothetical protein PanWU01x14_252830 [Parasponia andersonii]|uniref:Uncharacterized protein n=1 Tax=Parasponia andersonii TaxID=3476 RepID=A0A2P5BBV8_PARAD|nr:hypothetical protein PanWU01x14_252830 [Parasponia andersonii]
MWIDYKDVELELKIPGEDYKKLLAQDKGNYIAAIAEEGHGKSRCLNLEGCNNALTERDRRSLGYYYKWDDASSNVKGRSDKHADHTAESKLGDKDIDWILQLSRFTNKNFEEFFDELCRFNRDTKLELKSSDLRLKINVRVKGYI